ncbi:hypothetical protein CMQ_7549 [Grosmannia clavigera kw1407]|uniref:FHF complex subunit HOOK-interacting protein C-terminal domain-containing protein n=1 Tax=Grosmannia clavigera (strain kw1407 / UAMH 11150) TaxID=655863 RepID=F0XP07_GROCL|nr:uncharacterized protein CMQ_7549 [Grosmannia clavigera kw1407]EFX00547.1 hypothetical protein CMQ_7549 [Grosmannia clavigera kw1407]
MDFWSRLLSHSPLAAGNSRRDIANDPHRRRYRFGKEYDKLIQTWRNASNLTHENSAAASVARQIRELTDVLQDESRRPLPHTCLGFSAESQMYVPIGRIAATSHNLAIIQEAVYFFGTLIESEDESFVENYTFASSLTTLFVRVTGTNGIRLDSETETKVVELAFNVTTKIRLKPDMLPAWFHTNQDQKQPQPQSDGEKEPNSHERFKGKTQRQDFPLFYILMDYIHSEGRVGDFARTGLLYIIEAASASVTLEQWIVESDLSTLMATGLGALYSQLSRKLVIDHPSNGLPPILALSDYEHPQTTTEIVGSCSPDFQVQLETFLSHLLFWQDVLNHCHSVEVTSTLLEHFQVIFLQQLLYPSLLESSDIDGGSSVAVLTYLRRILESLDHPDMINLILHYLLALPDTLGAGRSATKNAVSAARKRKSMDLATMMAAKADLTATPILFNLVDLILACLKSHSQQTIHVTLQLVSVILRRHHRHALMTLLRTEALPVGPGTHRTIGAHQQEVEFFMSIAGSIGGQGNFDEVYDCILRDTVIRLESHPCSLKLIAPKVSANSHELPAIPDSLPGAPRDVSRHTIRAEDPLLNTVIDRLETFFINPIDTNLSLTEAILDLATCGFVALEGWLIRQPDKYVFADNEDTTPSIDNCDLDSNSAAFADLGGPLAIKNCRRRPAWTGLPRLLSVLQAQLDHVTAYHRSIPRFGDLLQGRRDAFQAADSAGSQAAPFPKYYKNSNQTTPVVDRTSIDGQRSGSPVRLSALEGFAQRIFSELGTPSRSASPRGRKDPNRATISAIAVGGSSGIGGSGGSSVGVSSGYGFATPTPTRPVGPPPKEFPLAVDNTSRRASGPARPYSSNSQRGETGLSDGRDGTIASQVVAFQAVDRTILARRVGIPPAKNPVAPIPLNFNKQPQPQPDATDSKKDDDSHGDSSDDATDDSVKTGDDSEMPGVGLSAEEDDEEKTVTVSHILTNTVILQSFSLELAALLQARAGLFDEVRFA